jgi:DNA-binding CsgD family transcriptional regulator
MYYSELLSRDLVAKIRSGQPGPNSGTRLTAREKAVVTEISNGHTGKEIAKMLGMSPKTVDTHRLHVREKLKAANIADLVRYAIRNGLIEA